MATSVALPGVLYTDGMTWTSLLSRQMTGGTRVADAGNASAVAPLGGVFTGLAAALQVVPGSGLQVLVNAGYAAIPHPAAGHGAYLTGVMAQAALTVASNSSGSTRTDLVCITINDLGNSSSSAVVQILTGPASLPAASLLLAQVAVPNGASSISSGNISDSRTWTAPPGGIFPIINAAAAPAVPATTIMWDEATSQFVQGTGTAGQVTVVSFLQAGTQKITNTSAGAKGQTPGTPTSDPWGIGYGQIGRGGGKGGGSPATDGVLATEIQVTWTADGTSDYEIAYQWAAAVPAEAWVPAANVTGGQVEYRLLLDGAEVDSVYKVITDSPLGPASAGTASWYSSAAVGTTPAAGTHTATLSVITEGTNESGASGVFVGNFAHSAGTIFTAPGGWTSALTAENCSVRVQAVQPG